MPSSTSIEQTKLIQINEGKACIFSTHNSFLRAWSNKPQRLREETDITEMRRRSWRSGFQYDLKDTGIQRLLNCWLGPFLTQSLLQMHFQISTWNVSWVCWMSDGKGSRLNSLEIRGIGVPNIFRLTKHQHFLLLVSSDVREETFNLK